MKENEIIIQVLITSEDISKKRGSYIWTINGFNEFETIVNQLHYGRNEAIYVHIPEATDIDVIEKQIAIMCNTLIKNGKVQSAFASRMPMPVNCEGLHTVYGENNKLKEDRFMIVYTM